MRWTCLLGLICWFALAPRVTAQHTDDLSDHPVALTAPAVESAGKRAHHTLRSALVTAPFDGVVLQGTAEDPDLEGAIRFREDDAWGAWQPLYVSRSPVDASFFAAYRGAELREGQAFEVRFSAASGTGVRVRGAGVFDSRADSDNEPVTPLPEPAFQPRKTGIIKPPRLINRAAWGAEPFIGSPSPLAVPDYRRMAFHHAACCAAETMQEGIEQVYFIQDFHQNGRGWSDIGYHFLLDQSGRVYQGRPFLDDATTLEEVPRLAMGAHVGGANTGNIGVSVLGCYHPPEGLNCVDQLSPAAFDSLATLYAFLSERYGVSTDDLLGHRDQGTTATACPGDNNYARLPELRDRIDELLRTGNAPIASATLSAEVGPDGVVRLSWTFSEVVDLASYRLERRPAGADEEANEVVYQATSPAAETLTDPAVATTGAVVYELYARGVDGREQLLAATEVVVERPGDYTLSESFPNPFTDRATIRYYLSFDGIVTLEVYDAAGRRVRRLVNAYQEGDHWYTAEVDATNLASGTYYTRLLVVGFSDVAFDETKPLVLVR